MNKHNRLKGFTLIELILYVALVAIFLTGAIYFAWDVIYGREKAFHQQIVEHNARIAMSKIAYEIRRAEDIVSVSDGQIILDNGGTTTTILLVGNGLEITTSGLGPYGLISNQARVTNTLIFSNLTSPGDDSKNIKVTLTLEQAQPAVSGQLTASTTVEESVELNSQFNQSRSLLIGLSNVNLNGLDIEGISIENTGNTDVIVDQLFVSWTGTAGGENITNVQIDAGVEEWSGSQGTDSTIDLSDFTLTTTDGEISIDYLTFDSDMSGATIVLNFILSDSSTANSQLILGSPATPTPTPPPASCSEYCTFIGYALGTCRKNAKTCGDNGETHESVGDVYCTGGPNADTCCCAP